MSIAGCEEKAALERRGFRPNFLVTPTQLPCAELRDRAASSHCETK